uniref:Core shell protein Gag P30 domain-containing protein n=1 Tax=Rousettus aegyptiacus TaxID=9407 RepID=A0A7J8CI71_ROUAE|nr:hypothetical protein HJG63_009075 [Rousettus aegyptiacus]
MVLLFPLWAGHQPIPPPGHSPLGISTTPGVSDRPFMVYVPFLTSDLYSWKAQNLPFSEKPQALMGFLESVFQTHCPTWDDCQQVLVTLFTMEECRCIWAEAQKIAAGGRRAEEAWEQIEEEFPSTSPDWGHNFQAGRMALDRYHQLGELG